MDVLRGPRALALLAGLTAVAPACEGRATGPEARDIEIDVVAREDLPALDPDRSYEALDSTVDAEAVLAALLEAGIPVLRAWLPLDDQCADPLGPRFTVELERADTRILDRGFRPGTGRLACATTLRRYTIRSP